MGISFYRLKVKKFTTCQVYQYNENNLGNTYQGIYMLFGAIRKRFFLDGV